MKIRDCMIAFCQTGGKTIYSSSEIRDGIAEQYGKNRGSIIPSDYCYNRINKGIVIKSPFLISLGEADYKFVGVDYLYDGPVMATQGRGKPDRIAGWWHNGVYVEYQDDSTEQAKNQEILEELYVEYMRILDLELRVLGGKPTECRALIGRIGEFKAAMELRGSLAELVNQKGWDVRYGDNRHVSVKTTAQQRSGFVSISKSTLELVDEIRVYQYKDGSFVCLAHDTVEALQPLFRPYENRLELDISKAKKHGIRV